MEQLTAELQNIANKLRALWGNNPDSETIEEAIKALQGKNTTNTTTEAEAPATTRATKRTTKEN